MLLRRNLVCGFGRRFEVALRGLGPRIRPLFFDRPEAWMPTGPSPWARGDGFILPRAERSTRSGRLVEQQAHGFPARAGIDPMRNTPAPVGSRLPRPRVARAGIDPRLPAPLRADRRGSPPVQDRPALVFSSVAVVLVPRPARGELADVVERQKADEQRGRRFGLQA
jgi:hypothetical protein